MLEKIRERPGNTSISYVEFSSKMDPKLTKKSRNTAVAAKIDEKTLPGTTFFRKKPIFCPFGDPRGDPKTTKNLRALLSKGDLGAIWQPLSVILCIFLDFGSTCGASWLHFGSARLHFQLIFVVFFVFRGHRFSSWSLLFFPALQHQVTSLLANNVNVYLTQQIDK